jgi:hypothetical protein
LQEQTIIAKDPDRHWYQLQLFHLGPAGIDFNQKRLVCRDSNFAARGDTFLAANPAGHDKAGASKNSFAARHLAAMVKNG